MKKEEDIVYRYRGLRKDGEIVESNDLNDYELQDFYWFEEIATMTKEQWENLRLRSNLPPLQTISRAGNLPCPECNKLECTSVSGVYGTVGCKNPNLPHHD